MNGNGDENGLDCNVGIAFCNCKTEGLRAGEAPEEVAFDEIGFLDTDIGFGLNAPCNDPECCNQDDDDDFEEADTPVEAAIDFLKMELKRITIEMEDAEAAKDAAFERIDERLDRIDALKEAIEALEATV